MIKFFSRVSIALLVAASIITTSCDDTLTYAEELEIEQESIDAFMSSAGRYTKSLPSDTSNIIVSGTPGTVSTSAPFYSLSNGVYMQVVSKGNSKRSVEVGDEVYFRFLRINLNTWYDDQTTIDMFNTEGYGGVGNYYWPTIDDYYFEYDPSDDVSYSQYYTTYGMGIQYPLQYLYDEAIVYLVVPSKIGFVDEVSYVVPYLYYIEYNVKKN